MRSIIATILLTLLGFGCTSPATPKVAQTPMQIGEQRAKTDIEKGKMRILYYGKPWSEGKPLIDDETGLPVELVAGCVVTEEFVQETNAYNNIMREKFKNKNQKR